MTVKMTPKRVKVTRKVHRAHRKVSAIVKKAWVAPLDIDDVLERIGKPENEFSIQVLKEQISELRATEEMLKKKLEDKKAYSQVMESPSKVRMNALIPADHLWGSNSVSPMVSEAIIPKSCPRPQGME